MHEKISIGMITSTNLNNHQVFNQKEQQVNWKLIRWFWFQMAILNDSTSSTFMAIHKVIKTPLFF